MDSPAADRLPAAGPTADTADHPAAPPPDPEAATQTGPGSGTVPAGPLPEIPGYEIEEELARGGMGVVYKARHLRLNRPAAVKMIIGGKYHDPAARIRFLVEAEAVAALDHPHVVGVYEFGQVDGVPFFALEYVAGGTLAGRIARDTRFQPRAAAELVAKLADALAAAHAKGIVHRDLKPANVLLTAAGEPKVTDFGLAKVGRSDMTVSGAVMGTPSYMSPEQAAGRTRDIGTPTDVYALGAILYELLTGRPPFKGDSVMATIQEVLTREPERPRVADATIPRDLETVCLKCLEKNPDRRYRTAAALGADLGAFLAGRPIAARPVGSAERAWKWVRRNPVVASLLTVVGLLLVGVGVGGAVAAARFRDKAEAALKAKREADDARQVTAVQLWKSRLSEARASTRTGQQGQRFASLALLKSALADDGQAGLTDDYRRQFRDVAVAALALPDVEVLKEWEGCPVGTTSLAIDGRFERYARAGPDGAVTVRRVEDDAELFALPATGSEQTVVLSESGKLLVVGPVVGFGGIRGRVYDLSGREPEVLDEPDMVLNAEGPSVYVTPDDGRVIYATGAAVAVWDRATRQTATYPLPGGQCGRAALSANGTQAAVPCWSNSGSVVHVRDVGTGLVVTNAPFPQRAQTTAFHPAGRLLAVNQGRSIVVRDLDSGRDVATLEGHRTDGLILTFDPSGDYLLSNDWSNTLRIWDWRAGRQQFSFLSHCGGTVFSGDRAFAFGPDQSRTRINQLVLHSGRYHFGPVRSSVYDLKIAPDGRFAVAGVVVDAVPRHLVVTDTARGTELGRFTADYRLLHVGADGSLMGCGRRGTVRWPRTELGGSGVIRYGPPELVAAYGSDNVNSAAADGRVVAIPANGAGAVVVRTDRLGVPVSLGPQPDTRFTAVSPDGRFVATGNQDALPTGVCVWDARTGGEVAKLPVAGGQARFSPDGRWLATFTGGNRLWRTDTWAAGPDIADPLDTAGCAFSPDGRVLAVAGFGAVRLVRVSDGAHLARLPYGEQARIMPTGFSPDGGVLYAVGAERGEVTAWDLRKLRAELKDLGLDWDEPPLPPRVVPAAVTRVEFVGTELLTNAAKRAAHRDREIRAGIRDNPFDSEWYTRWGVAAQNSGFTAGARFLFGVALTLNSGREDAWLRRAEVHYSVGRYAAAAEDASVVLRRHPTQLEARWVRSAAYRQLGRPADAAADLSVRLRFYPNDCGALVQRGAAYAAAGDGEKAAADLRLADRLAGGAGVVARNELAWYYLTGPAASRNPERGLELAITVVAEKSTLSRLNTLGVAQYRNGLFKEATATLDQSLGAGDRDEHAFNLYFLAMCHFKLGDAAKAEDHFTRAVSAAATAADLGQLQRDELGAFRAEAAELLGRK